MKNPLDSRQLQAFVTLANNGSFTQTARDLFLTQSAISHAMKALEGDVGCRLLDRLGKKVTLTVLDDGAPFDPLSAPSPNADLSIDDRPIGGLGVHMMRKLMDEISYQRRNGQNHIVMTKRMSLPAHVNP